MGCSVLTVVAALCLTGHLPLGAGQAHGQQDTHLSDAAEVVTPSRIAAEARDPSAGSDGRLSASQLAAVEEGDATPLIWDATTAASLGVVSAAPEHLVFKVDRQEDGFTTTPEDIVTTPPKDSFTTSQKNILTTTRGNVTATHEGSGDLVMTPILEDGRVPTRVLQLVICACPLPTPDGCRRFLSNLYIDGKDDQYLDTKVRKHFCTSLARFSGITVVCPQEKLLDQNVGLLHSMT